MLFVFLLGVVGICCFHNMIDEFITHNLTKYKEGRKLISQTCISELRQLINVKALAKFFMRYVFSSFFLCFLHSLYKPSKNAIRIRKKKRKKIETKVKKYLKIITYLFHKLKWNQTLGDSLPIYLFFPPISVEKFSRSNSLLFCSSLIA